MKHICVVCSKELLKPQHLVTHMVFHHDMKPSDANAVISGRHPLSDSNANDVRDLATVKARLEDSEKDIERLKGELSVAQSSERTDSILSDFVQGLTEEDYRRIGESRKFVRDSRETAMLADNTTRVRVVYLPKSGIWVRIARN